MKSFRTGVIEFINNTDHQVEDILKVFEEVGSHGDIILLEHDGARGKNPFTAVIIVAGKPDGIFRCDADTIVNALQMVLPKYIKRKQEV